jgi:regulator of sigma E protease
MIIYNVLIGLAALGVVVFVHELGHFLAARLVGIQVEAFSIGWGRPFFKKKVGDVEYRLGVFPIGGYCKMAGEHDFEKAWKNKKNNIPPAEGSFFAARPWRRIVTVFAGPFFNIVFAVLAFSLIWGIGFEYETMENRVVLDEASPPTPPSPAWEAGLRSGDRVTAIDGVPVKDFHDLRRIISVNAEKELRFDIERGGEPLTLAVEPMLRKESGAGYIGVMPWTEPLIGAVEEGSPAWRAGLRAGDRITRIEGMEVPNTYAISAAFAGSGEMPPAVRLEYERGGASAAAELEIPENEEESLGIRWQGLRRHTPRYSVWGAVQKGAEETLWMFISSLRSFRLLFRGIDLTSSLSGPARIVWMAGEITTEGFGESVGSGLRALVNFMAVISIALGITNLLPLPVLDGGSILLFTGEALCRRPLNPKVFAAFQAAGVIIIAGLMLFAITGDILFFVRR